MPWTSCAPIAAEIRAIKANESKRNTNNNNNNIENINKTKLFLHLLLFYSFDSKQTIFKNEPANIFFVK